MNTEKSTKNAAATGIIAAIAASSCCLPPVIAAIAGIGGISSSLSWIEPARPYLIALAAISIGYTWYVFFTKPEPDNCGCPSKDMPRWFQKKGFLIGITLLSIISISFPYYSSIFFQKDGKKTIQEISPKNIISVNLEVNGMTCESCEHLIDHVMSKAQGVVFSKSSYQSGKAQISYDENITDIDNLIILLQDETGYSITNYEFYKHNN